MSDTIPKIPLDLAKDPVVAFYDALSLINSEGIRLTVDDLTISDVVPDSSRPEANTRFTMTPVPTSKKIMGDAQTRWYWRWGMTEVMALMGYHDNTLSYTGLPADWAEPGTHAKAVAMVNLTLGTTLRTDYTTWTELSRTAEQVVGVLAINDGVLTIFGEIELTVDML